MGFHPTQASFPQDGLATGGEGGAAPTEAIHPIPSHPISHQPKRASRGRASLASPGKAPISSSALRCPKRAQTLLRRGNLADSKQNETAKQVLCCER